MYYAIDCSMFPGQDFLRTADGVIALYPSRDEALEVVNLFGGTVVPMKVV